MEKMSSKITIIGAGSVGATIAYKLSYEDIASEIVMIDINKDKVEGEVMDIKQEPASEARSPSLPETMKMRKIPISLSSHRESHVNLDRQESSLHRQTSTLSNQSHRRS